MRNDKDYPEAIEKWGWKFHHLGVPTTTVREDERYLPQLKFAVSGFPTSPVGVEWMRFDPDTEIHPLVVAVPHLAFVVQDLDYELANRGLKILTPPTLPSDGIRVAMVEHNGAPVELMELSETTSSSN